MKKINIIFIGITIFLLLCSLVYASVASTNKSSYLPWQGTQNGYYDSEHNVGTDYNAESRFSFITGTIAGTGSVIKDSVTGLEWESYGNNDKINWLNASLRCTNLNLGGQTDWRLPNVKELHSINDYSFAYPIRINSNYFTTEEFDYWSLTVHAQSSSYAWDINPSGSIDYSAKTLTKRVRCVRHD